MSSILVRPGLVLIYHDTAVGGATVRDNAEELQMQQALALSLQATTGKQQVHACYAKISFMGLIYCV